MKEYSTKQLNQWDKDLAFCQKYIFKYGSNYKLGTLLFDKNIKESTMVLYAFFRSIDEIVDSPTLGKTDVDIEIDLNKIKQDWQNIIDKTSDIEFVSPILRATFKVFEENSIPFQYSFDFIDSMIMDTKIKRYNTYADLEKYMHGSATVVGYIMTHVVGYTSMNAFMYAKDFGEAMQLTNFMRDIEEDYVQRDRVYLPQEMMRMYDVTEDMISSRKATPELRNLLKELDLKTQELYRKGRMGFSYLNPKNLRPIKIAGDIYEYNLKILRKRNYNPFGKRIRVPLFRKLLIILKNI